MEADSAKRNKKIFKYTYYAFTLAVLAAAAICLYYAYRYIHISRYLWCAVFAFVAVYVFAALVFTKKTNGFNRFLTHTILLQLIPITATVVLSLEVLDRRSYRPLVGNVNKYEKAFNDLQAVQKRSALKNGVKPIERRAELSSGENALIAEDKLVAISSNSGYIVRSLTYSMPYVVPKVETLLEDLAEAFQKETNSKARFEVTSVLRTDEDIAKLKDVNGNAVKDSCHRYGTTIDVSYVHFNDDMFKPRSTSELRLALSKALHGLRESGRCYVKIEKKQCCYHITVR